MTTMTAKVDELMNLMDRNMDEKVSEAEWQAWLTEKSRCRYFLDKTGRGRWPPEEEKLMADLTPEEQWAVHHEISARADGYESWDAAMMAERERDTRRRNKA
jgi:hypothetical protein